MRLFLLILSLCLVVPVRAEQRVLMFGYNYSTISNGDPVRAVMPPQSVLTLLKQGWTVISVSTSSASYYGYLVIFVLQSPAPSTPL